MESMEEIIESAKHYTKCLRAASDENLEKMEEETRKQEIGTGSFLSEMMEENERERRELVRWALGIKPPVASEAKRSAIYSDMYPQHVVINQDALGLIKLKEIKRFPEVDQICTDICNAVAGRLPRTLNGYKYVDGDADETLNVPNIGEMKVKLHDVHNVFRFVDEVESNNTKICNGRKSGRQYMKLYSESSLPHEINISPLNLSVDIYSDDSGIYAGKADENFSRRHRKLSQGEWNKEKTRISSWLRKNILKNILLLPENTNRADKPPEAIPYPKDMGELYTWIRAHDAAKLILTGYDPSKVYPHERSVAEPSHRLVPFGVKGDHPEEAHRGFTYCTLDTKSAENYIREDWSKINPPGNFDEVHVLTKVRPKNGEEIFVVDYKILDNDKEYNELLSRLGRTMVPASKYRMNYEEPAVIIGRNLGFDEVRVIPQIQYNPRNPKRN